MKESRFIYRNVEKFPDGNAEKGEHEGIEQAMSQRAEKDPQANKTEIAQRDEAIRVEQNRVTETLNALERELGNNAAPDGAIATEDTEVVADSLNETAVLPEVEKEREQQERIGETEGAERDPSQADS